MLKPTLLAPLVAAWLTPPPAAPPKNLTDDFTLQGSATVLDEQCLRLTPDAQWSSGSAWSKTALDLDEGFDVRVQLGFGDRDALGADGIVFVLSPQRQTGWRGEGMGFAGLRGALGIELDTYQNHRQGDPAEDHLALLVDGVTYHRGGEGHLVRLPNLEDGRRHDFRVTWTPKADVLRVSLDGKVVATYPGHVLRHVFDGDSVIYWGFTAGTGRKTNAHDVCFAR